MLFQIITTSLITFGVFFLLFSASNTRKVVKILHGKLSFALWKKLYYFMLFFAACYLLVIGMILLNMLNYLVIMTGVVFAFGAVFVFLVTRLGRVTIFDLEKEVQERTFDLRESHKKLRKSNLKHKTILQALPDVMFVLDKDGKCHEIKFSEKDKVTEKMKTVFIKKNIYDIESKDKLENAYLNSQRIVHTHYLNKEKLLRNKKIIHLHYQLEYDDRKFDFEARCVSMDKNKVVCVVRDTTEMKNLERKIISKKEEALQEAKLKSQFLANMSHEIRTPLNAVIGITDLLLEESVDQKQADYLKIIQESGNTLLYLVNDILDFSKVQTGDIALERIPFHLASTIENVTNSMKIIAEKKEIRLIQKIAKGINGSIIGDPHRLKQILINLINNALKFTENGDVQLAVTQCYEDLKDDGQVRLRFSVIDQGIGIPKEKQGQIFEEFVQSDMSTTRKYGGTGLGLAICKKLVKLMGGEIGIKSPVHPNLTFPGSEFWFEIPFQKDNSAGAEAENGDHTGDISLKNKSICIVSDEQRVLREVKAYCRGMGVEVRIPKNTAAPDPSGSDIVLVDVAFRGNEGFSFAGHLKKMSPKTPVIIYTTAGMSGDAKKCRELDIDGYLAAPLSENAFREILEKLLLPLGNGQKQLLTKHSIVKDQSSLEVLVAEDNEVNQMLIKSMLRKNNCTIDLAENGERAIQLAKNKNYDLIFMDVTMPIVDGYEASTKIRQHNQKTPIIAVTAHALPEYKKKCFDSGMNHVLLKPFKMEDITKVVDKFASKHVN